MEGTLNKAIGNALDLKTLPRIVLTANIQLRDKLNILRAATRMSSKLTSDEVSAYHATLSKITNATSKRNMMAHDLFWPSDDGRGVEFNVIKAKNDLQFPSEIWDISRFESEVDAIAAWTVILDELANKIGTVAPINSLLALAHPTPGPEPASQGIGGFLFNLSPASSSSGYEPVGDETTPRTNKSG